MIKIVVFILFIISQNPFASAAGGHGAGNGGVGMLCHTYNDFEHNKTVFVLTDIAEDSYDQYVKYTKASKRYFVDNYDSTDNSLSAFYNHFYFLVDSLDLSKDVNRKKIQEAYQEIIFELKLLLAEDMPSYIKNNLVKNKLVSLEELTAITEARKLLQSQTIFKLNLSKQYIKNLTLDHGKIEPIDSKYRLGFSYCDYKLYQAARLYQNQNSAMLKEFPYVLELHLKSLSKMDDLNIRALLWHEAIFLALKNDKTSKRTRKIVQHIMRASQGRYLQN